MKALRRWGLGVLTALVMVAAGCGGSGGGDEVASCVSPPGNDKFCLVADPAGDGGLKRVRALRDITVVVDGQPVLVARRGDLGGWVEGEGNLSAGGSAWIAGDAKVFGDARVEDDALVTGFAEVSGGAVVKDRAQVSGQAKVFRRAQVSDQAQVVDAAVVCSAAGVYGNAVVEDEAVVCGRAFRPFAQSGKDAAGSKANVAGMLAWVQGWGELGLEPVWHRAGFGSTGVHVFGDAVISDGAWVFEHAKVFGEAEISDQARVYEHAQVFDDVHVYDNAHVFGNAKVFTYSASKYVSGFNSNGEPTLSSAFEEDYVARQWWTDSQYEPHAWVTSIATVEGFFESGIPITESISKESPDWEDNWGSIESELVVSDPTRVHDYARVHDNALVWGSSQVNGYSEIFQHARASGGATIYGGQLCGTDWVNGEDLAIDRSCRASGFPIGLPISADFCHAASGVSWACLRG
ncbi:hypothetical protein [Candidatus Poriferisocius sp.]|uniref:hypothetical protein n=1 Tax=Candidatus Poriferisocius sp. TaxID=3101276 RepID=UPI003B5B9ADC